MPKTKLSVKVRPKQRANRLTRHGRQNIRLLTTEREKLVVNAVKRLRTTCRRLSKDQILLLMAEELVSYSMIIQSALDTLKELNSEIFRRDVSDGMYDYAKGC